MLKKFECTAYMLKAEIMIPFVLADGGGLPGAFEAALFVALATICVNGATEERIQSWSSMKRGMLLVVGLGGLIVFFNGAMLTWWKSNGLLRNPIAYYGIDPTMGMVALYSLCGRILAVWADFSEHKSGTSRRIL